MAATATTTYDELTDLVQRASAGDDAAWQELTDRFAQLLAGVARRYRLTAEDAADVAQTCWLRLLEHIDRIDDPRRLAGWLHTVARNECWRLLKAAGRQQPLGETADRLPDPSPAASPEDITVRNDARRGVRRAVDGLPGTGGRVLQALLDEPGASYRQLSGVLQMPVGSIGPTRGRALARLRTDDSLLALAG